MGDVFKEQLVKRENTFKETAIRICGWVLVVLLSILVFFNLGPFIGLLVAFVAGFGARFLMGYLNVEYEYIFTNGELDIDIIYDLARRKRVFTMNMKQFEIMAHVEDKNHEGTFAGAQETRDYSSGVIGSNTYAFLTVYEGKKVKVIIEPNDKMLKAFSGVLTRRKLHLRSGVVLI